jgi:ElaB/YqjD/DUF883 family membrane-anchored ribosome-binding protein
VLYILAALLIILMVLVVLLFLRQGQVNQAQLDPGETDKIVAALSSNLTRVQGEIQKTGIEQLVAQNKTVLDGETARGEEQLKARQGEIDKGLSEVRQELGKLRELVLADSRRHPSGERELQACPADERDPRGTGRVQQAMGHVQETDG